ncbi:YHS domain-containing (seleno)protein [Oscillatoria amoena NRMC-F 0135]|nr:YHS domain-containing (seleno)protein [Oscillatoria amoena NRMC-F 0135]
MKVWLLLLIWLTAFVAIAQNVEERKKHFNLKSNLALQGYDPVSYFTTKPVEGRIDLTHTHNGVIYRFASQENLNRFKSDPDKYEPAYGGWCAYAMGENGEKVKIDPETYKIIDGKVYLFYNFWTNNTLTTWNKNEKQLKEAADRNWAKFVR